jgi:hypothetical protein
VVDRVQRLGDELARETVRPVVVALPPLVLHHVALAVHDGRRHGRQQVAHAVALDEERELERIARERLHVVRAVGRRRAVGRAADLLEPLVDPPSGTCFDPSNMRCSKRCAKPVRPGISWPLPTWYQTFR